jgi:hypothetical protein
MTAWHAEIERLIETSAREWTFLRPGMIAANARRWWAPQIRAGDVVRRPRLEEISPEDARHELLTLMPDFIVNMLLGAWAAAIGQPALVTPAVAKITGAPARTFREWAADGAEAFRA